MNKNKWMIGVAVSAFLCVTGGAHGQSHSPSGQNRGRGILTPAMKAAMDEKWRLDQAAIAALDEDQYSAAEADARQSLSLDVGSGLCEELLATALNAQGKTQEALQAYKAMADQGNTLPRNEVPYALLLLKTGQWVQAVDAYNKAMAQYPEQDLLRMNSRFSADAPKSTELAVALHIAQGLIYIGGDGWGHHYRQAEAMSEFEQALRLAPDSALANYYYGFGWQRLTPAMRVNYGHAAQVKASLQKALWLGQGSVKAAAQETLDSMVRREMIPK